MTLDEQVEVYQKLRGSLETFAKLFFDNVMEYDTPEFHSEIFSLLETKDRVAIAAPRGFAKSTLVDVIFACWIALLKIKKDICIISASETLAVEFVRKIRLQLETNPKILGIFGDVKSEKWTEGHLILSNGVNIRAKGAGGQIRGFRPDCLILDDIETDESVESEEQRKKLKDWLFKACLNTLLPGGQMVIVGTLIHPLAVLSDLIDSPREGWERRKYTAYKDGIEAPGHELWPKARPHEWLQRRKSEIGSWAFAAEFMNDPRLDATAPIHPEQIRYWKDLPSQYSVVITMDPAYSEDEKSDYKVASAIAIDSQLNRYLLEYVRTHDPSGQYIDEALNMFLRYRDKCNAFGVPNSGTEKEFFKSVCSRAMQRKIAAPITELKNTFLQTGSTVANRNKKKRIIASLQPLFEQGRYYIHANHHEAREELLTIGSSRWDDVVDTMSYAEQLLQPVFYETPSGHAAEALNMQGRSTNYGMED